MLKKLFALFLCLGIGASVWILPQLADRPLWYVAVPLCFALLAGTFGCAPINSSSVEEKTTLLSKVGITLAFGLAIAYRFAYLETVPSGIDMAEPPIFTARSAAFVKKGFFHGTPSFSSLTYRSSQR